jgi:hypothetical protein
MIKIIYIDTSNKPNIKENLDNAKKNILDLNQNIKWEIRKIKLLEYKKTTKN